MRTVLRNRSSFRATGRGTSLCAWTAFALVAGQLPIVAPAQTFTIRASLCGADGVARGVSMTFPRHSDNQGRKSPMGCHTACLGRRRAWSHSIGDGPDELGD